MAAVFRRKKKEPLLDSGPEAFNLIMKEAVVREFLDENDNVSIYSCLLTLRDLHLPPSKSKGKGNWRNKRQFLGG